MRYGCSGANGSLLTSLTHVLPGCAGKHRGRAEVLPGGDVRISLVWDDPLGGTGSDTYSMPNPQTLHVSSELHMRGGSTAYRTVYHLQQ